MSGWSDNIHLAAGRQRGRLGCVWHRGWTRTGASVWSLWSQLCALNAFSACDVERVLEGQGAARSVFQSEPQWAWLAEAHDLDEHALSAACAVRRRFDRLAVQWQFLRYCPACMRHSFHAACHQHLAVTHCPAHHLKLLERCQQCSAHVSASFDAARRHPFGCPRCSGLLTGVRRAPPSAIASKALDHSLEGTTAALDRGHAHHPVRAADLKSSVGVGHTTWWWGADPFVAESRWAPRSIALEVRDEDVDAVHAHAWRVLVSFVTVRGLVQDHAATVCRLADDIERLDCRMLRLRPPALLDWALATLVVRYGGHRAFEHAARLSWHGARPSLFSLSPQASRPVEASAQGNAIVLAAELRAELVRLLGVLSRDGLEAAFQDALAMTRSPVPWHLQEHAVAEDHRTCSLHWRGIGLVRFERTLARYRRRSDRHRGRPIT